MAIVVVGVNYKTVPLDVLERLTFTPETLPKGLALLADRDPFHEAAIVSTCNRVEVYATVHRFHPAVQAVRHLLSDVSGVSQEVVASGLYTYYDTTAVRHLFCVASGIDSMVMGEPQILGQVREAFQAARDEGAARRMLTALFQRALRVGKRARTETAIARHVVSLPQAAARMADELTGGLSGQTVVVLGSGRMGELAGRAARDLGAQDLIICNRTPERAHELAGRLGGTGRGLERLDEVLRPAAAVIAATSSDNAVLDVEVVAEATRGREQPLVAIDLGMPRDVDPSARDIPGFVLRDIDDLRELAERGARRRAAEIPKVERIVDEEVDAFCAWERSLALGPAITAVRALGQELARSEVEKAARRLSAGPAEREELEALARGIVNKLLHLPVTQVKELVRGKDGQVYLEAFQELFDLDVPDD